MEGNRLLITAFDPLIQQTIQVEAARIGGGSESTEFVIPAPFKLIFAVVDNQFLLVHPQITSPRRKFRLISTIQQADSQLIVKPAYGHDPFFSC